MKIAFALALALMAGCASAPPTVDLSGKWPAAAPAYDAATRDWTRSAVVRKGVSDGLDNVFTIHVTAMSAEWRAAWVAERSRRFSLGDEERTALAETQRSEAEKTWQFEIILNTDNPRWNDLGKWPRSMWRIALVTAAGKELLPEKVVADRRTPQELAEYFPDAGAFYKAYIVTFSRTAADGTPVVVDGGAKLSLEFAGTLGKATLIWQAR
jgi:hypothetical protein